jgi:hypothetical protein
VDTIKALTRHDGPIVSHQRWIVPHDDRAAGLDDRAARRAEIRFLRAQFAMDE